MKKMYSGYICVALLPSIIQCLNLTKILDDMARSTASNSNIYGIIKPLRNGFIQEGGFGFTYKGIWLVNNQEIAIKFTPNNLHVHAQHEYQIYTWLEAINDTKVEEFGIPSVYFYGLWNNHTLLAITLLDSDFSKRCKQFELTEADILIVLRDFVRATKYIHSKGICHNDITLDNILFRKEQGFIIDYNIATMMYGPNGHGLYCTKHDFKIFLLSICYLVHVEHDDDYDDITIDSISQIEHEGLRKVYLKFAKIAFDDEMPNYNGLFKMINEEIDKCDVPKPAIVSWLTPDDRINAKNKPTKSIETIKNPVEMNHFKYRKANFHYFDYLKSN